MEQVRGLCHREADVDGEQGGVDAPDAPHEIHPLRARREPDRDHVARAQPHALEPFHLR
jgi:hypothetical protein